MAIQFYEYAQFAGGHSFQLPYTINADYMVSVDFQFLSYINDQHVIGNSYNYQYLHLTEYSNKWYTSSGSSEVNYQPTEFPLDARHTFINNKNGKNWMDGVEVTNYNPTTQGSAYLQVGGRNGAYNFRGKMWYYKIESISTGNVICELRPAKDETHEGLYDIINNTWYTGGITVYNLIPVVTTKYLIESGNNYYTVSGGSLVNLGSTLNAALFTTYGLDDAPDWSDYSSLSNPSVLCWDSDSAVDMTATTTGVPGAQTIVSSDLSTYPQGASGIGDVSITETGSPKYAFSVDSGTTWKVWSGSAWVTSTGVANDMSSATVEAITQAQWDSLISGENTIRVRFTLFSDSDSVSEISVNYA